jgi:hypothetical protein
MDVNLYISTSEKNFLRAFQNEVLRKTFGPKRVDVLGGWKRGKRAHVELRNM